MYALLAASLCAWPIVKVAITAMPPALPNFCCSATTQECGFIAEVVDNFFHYGSHCEERLGPVQQQVGGRGGQQGNSSAMLGPLPVHTQARIALIKCAKCEPERPLPLKMCTVLEILQGWVATCIR